MKVKVTHKECFARQTVGVFKEVGKLMEKTWSQRICSFSWVEGGRYRTSWLVACCMLGSAERFQSRGAERERTKWYDMRLKESLMTKAMPPPFAPDPPAERGKERTEYPGEARSAILASSPAGRSQVSVSSMMSMSLY